MDNMRWSQKSPVINSIEATFAKTKQSGINWTWKSVSDVSESSNKKDVYFAWSFEWDELKKQGIEGFEVTIAVSSFSNRQVFNLGSYRSREVVSDFPKTLNVRRTRSGQWIELFLGTEELVDQLINREDVVFECVIDIKPIKNYDGQRYLEETFAASDKTDAILVVEGKKLHVNRQFLSFHSEFFKTLFNSEFEEKSMDEIPIGDVKYEDFARFLSFIYPNPIAPTMKNSTSLLELADRFMIPMVTRIVEPFLICNENVRVCKKIALADQFALKNLLESCLDSIKTAADFKKITETPYFEELSDATKVTILHKLLSFL